AARSDGKTVEGCGRAAAGSNGARRGAARRQGGLPCGSCAASCVRALAWFHARGKRVPSSGAQPSRTGCALRPRFHEAADHLRGPCGIEPVGVEAQVVVARLTPVLVGEVAVVTRTAFV